MEQQMPFIAVLLTCHNRKNKTLQCLAKLFGQKGHGLTFNIEVFLVDDGSVDGTGEAIATQYPRINIIKGDGNLFWNRGMHLAWKTASQKSDFDFYLWLNDDTFIYPGAILLMLESYLLSGKKAIICGATQSEFTKKYTYGGQKISGKNIEPNGSLQECELMNGNFVLVSRPVFKEVGMLDDLFHHAIGDRDYGLRAIRKRFKILITPGYIGNCEEHDKLPNWCLPSTPLKRRIKLLYSPHGFHPYYFFVYENRHFGLLPAIKHYFTIHLRALFPSLWT
jgi:GT2 family glycosyltransferase